MYQKHQTEINPFEADASTKKINELERKWRRFKETHKEKGTESWRLVVNDGLK
jgi:hypothetical protein